MQVQLYTVIVNYGSVTVAAPLLGPLQDNGGPTETHALLAGSPAIDAAASFGCVDEESNPLTADQRGFQRPANGTAPCYRQFQETTRSRIILRPLLVNGADFNPAWCSVVWSARSHFVV